MPENLDDQELITGDSSLMNPLQSILGALSDETFRSDVFGDPEQFQMQDFVPALSTAREAAVAGHRFKEAKEATNAISKILRNAEGTGHAGVAALDLITPLIPMAGIVKTLSRGFEAGTLAKPFKQPLEMGGHFAVDKAIANNFKLRYGDKGELVTINRDINPLKVRDTGGEWTPAATAKVIDEVDGISDYAKREILKIGNDYIVGKGKIRSVDDLERLQVEGNQKIQNVLRNEGYDSLIYDNAVEAEQKGATILENVILFDNPLSTAVGTDISKMDTAAMREAFFKDAPLKMKIKDLKKLADPNVPLSKTKVQEREYLDSLKTKIREEGLKRPIAIAKRERGDKAYIADGHHRLIALEELGYDEVPVELTPNMVDFDGGSALKNTLSKGLTKADVNIHGANIADITQELESLAREKETLEAISEADRATEMLDQLLKEFKSQ